MEGPVSQRIAIFQQGDSAAFKVAGIEEYGQGLEIVAVHSLPTALPPVIDEPQEFFPDTIGADLVLSFLHHPDLAEYLVRLCNRLGIPVIASGHRIPGAICPFTCCGLGRRPGLGPYGERFGVPELRVELDGGGRIAQVEVVRGASCGATWQVAPKLRGLEPEQALHQVGRLVQHICMADPSAFDPISGKSALHYAGDVHAAALRRAIKSHRR